MAAEDILFIKNSEKELKKKERKGNKSVRKIMNKAEKLSSGVTLSQAKELPYMYISLYNHIH